MNQKIAKTGAIIHGSVLVFAVCMLISFHFGITLYACSLRSSASFSLRLSSRLSSNIQGGIKRNSNSQGLIGKNS